MSYSRLYEEVQTQGDKISTKWLRSRVIEISPIKKIHEQWSGVIDGKILRGFYIEGPLGPPVPVGENEALIVLARTMCEGPLGDHWRRFVLTKELMHAFDVDEEKTDTREKFDLQIEQFGDPKAPPTQQYLAELKAFWRALGVLCTQKKRKEYKLMITENQISYEVVAAALRLPVFAIREMMRNDFEKMITNSM